MIDANKIPKQTLDELIELLGYEKAEEFLKRKQYDFRAIQIKILTEGLKRSLRERFRI